jgi:DNA-binding SARP family transcriptional activator/tetratricopeptide (TPR) repeat protein
LPVDFKILGPVELSHDGKSFEIHGTRQQIVLAMLLLNANQSVTMDRLLEAIYGEDLPPTARAQAQISISSLRREFLSHSQDEVISTRGGGYAICVGDGELDSARFEELVAAAREAREAGKPDLAVARYRDAMRLWRGAALDNIDSQLVRVAASRLDELHISCNEERISLELQLGRHHELVSELIELVKQHPLREELRGQLMLALYRCDRMAEALQVYRDTRQTMIEELGIEPSKRLQQLERSILMADPALSPLDGPVTTGPARPRPPTLLPADIADFTGRSDLVRRIRGHLAGDREQERLAVPVAVVVGKSGIGKTTLGVHVSHVVASQFADGQLFADLHGASGHPVSPMQVLERFIRAFGVPSAQIPEAVDERAELYRNLVADRKILVVLDDAASESQLLPLLPGGPTAGVIITSRNRLAGLAGALRVDVDVFTPVDSADLLARIAGTGRVRQQSAATAAVAAHCGHLPLALRIAGARLAARPHWSMQQLADRLGDEANRLDELRHGEMGIRPSIAVTYDSVGEEARKLFRRLALLDLPLYSDWLSAALLDQPLSVANDLLDDLVNAQLIDVAPDNSGLDSQYRFHALIHVFARERLAAEEPVAERRSALERALGALLYLAEEARSGYYGGNYARFHSSALRWPLPEQLVTRLLQDPLSWYDRERTTLVGGVRQAAQAGFIELCWSLASSAVPLFESRVYLNDWRESNDIALEAARKAGHARGQAAMLYHMGSLHITQLQLDQALRELMTAVRLFAEAGDDQGTAHATFLKASADRLCGRLDEAGKGYEQALAFFRASGDEIATASVLLGLAQVRLEAAGSGDPMEPLSQALRLCQTRGYPRLEAQILHRLGEACLLTGDIDRAAETFRQALIITREIKDTIGMAYAEQGLSRAQLRQKDFDQARKGFQNAMDLAGSVGEDMAQALSLLGLCELELACGNAEPATELGLRAVSVFERLKTPLRQAQALTILSEAQAAAGDARAARASAAEAAALRQKAGGDASGGSS